MSDIAIQVEGISKRFHIGNPDAKPRPNTFRDVVSDTASRLANRILHPTRGHSDQQIDFWALRDVSFQLKEGDRLGIIGHNGSGKSTLLKILSRITDPTSGTARLKGRVASLLEVSTGFHPELTGRENIFLRGAILGMTRADIKRRFDEIVEFSGTHQFLETPIKHFSSGMYVRLAFSVSAHLEPDILIVDEVLAVGDAEFQKKCLTKMDSVSSEGRTVIFVSHSLGSVANLCNQGILLDHGRLVTAGPVQEVINRYLRIGATDHVPGVFEKHNLVTNRDIITKVEVLNEQLQPEAVFKYGAKMHVRLHTNPNVKKEFWVGMRIRNSRYDLLVQGGSWIYNANHPTSYRGGDTIFISLPPLRMVEDTYFIEFLLRDPKIFGPVEFLHDTVHFSLVNARPPGSPVNFATEHGIACIVWEDIAFVKENAAV